MNHTLFAVLLAASALMYTGEAMGQMSNTSAESLRVVDAKLCRAVRNRVVEEEDSTFALGSNVFLWLQTTGGTKRTITVTWKNGLYTHATMLTIGANRWRTWASKVVRISGEWTVTITGENGEVLHERHFQVK